MGDFSRGRTKKSTRGSEDSDDAMLQSQSRRKRFREFSRGLNSRDSDDETGQSQSSKFPKIIYTSRTHSQIKQVIQELKRSNYRLVHFTIFVSGNNPLSYTMMEHLISKRQFVFDKPNPFR